MKSKDIPNVMDGMNACRGAHLCGEFIKDVSSHSRFLNPRGCLKVAAWAVGSGKC